MTELKIARSMIENELIELVVTNNTINILFLFYLALLT